MPVSISGDGTFAGLTSVETINVLHPDAVDPNIVLSDDGSVALDSIPASIQSAIDGAVVSGIGSNVVQTVKTDAFSTSSATFTNVTGLSATITPTSATSKCLVLLQLSFGATVAAGNNGAMWRLEGGGAETDYIGDAAGSRDRSLGHTGRHDAGSWNVPRAMFNASGIFLSSPNTVSPLTFNVQVRANGDNVYVNRPGTDTDDGQTARTASSITVIEVKV
jgi:hypothetical protein